MFYTVTFRIAAHIIRVQKYYTNKKNVCVCVNVVVCSMFNIICYDFVCLLLHLPSAFSLENSFPSGGHNQWHGPNRQAFIVCLLMRVACICTFHSITQALVFLLYIRNAQKSSAIFEFRSLNPMLYVCGKCSVSRPMQDNQDPSYLYSLIFSADVIVPPY